MRTKVNPFIEHIELHVKKKAYESCSQLPNLMNIILYEKLSALNSKVRAKELVSLLQVES